MHPDGIPDPSHHITDTRRADSDIDVDRPREIVSGGHQTFIRAVEEDSVLHTDEADPF